jgi:hypothetical protein
VQAKKQYDEISLFCATIAEQENIHTCIYANVFFEKIPLSLYSTTTLRETVSFSCL